MGSGPMVVTEIRSQGSLQMPGVEDDEMVQAVSSYRADQALNIGIFCQGLSGQHARYHITGCCGEPSNTARV